MINDFKNWRDTRSFSIKELKNQPHRSIILQGFDKIVFVSFFRLEELEKIFEVSSFNQKYKDLNNKNSQMLHFKNLIDEFLSKLPLLKVFL